MRSARAARVFLSTPTSLKPMWRSFSGRIRSRTARQSVMVRSWRVSMKMKSTGPPPRYQRAKSPKGRRSRQKTATNCNCHRAIVDKIAQYATFCNKMIPRADVLLVEPVTDLEGARLQQEVWACGCIIHEPGQAQGPHAKIRRLHRGRSHRPRGR